MRREHRTCGKKAGKPLQPPLHRPFPDTARLCTAAGLYCFCPEALMQKLPDAQEALYSFWKQQVEWADAVLAGPGLGTGERSFSCNNGSCILQHIN